MAQLPPFQESVSLSLLPGQFEKEEKRPGTGNKQTKDDQDAEYWVGFPLLLLLYREKDIG